MLLAAYPLKSNAQNVAKNFKYLADFVRLKDYSRILHHKIQDVQFLGTKKTKTKEKGYPIF